MIALAKYAEPDEPGLPASNMVFDLPRTAIVITDPQIDFLSPDGVTWGLVGNSVTANKTVEHIEQLLKTAKANDIAVFISPHIVNTLSGMNQVIIPGLSVGCC